MSNIVNLTPHDIVVHMAKQRADVSSAFVYAPGGPAARVVSAPQEHLDTLANGVETYEPQRAIGVVVEPLDPTADGIIVSMMVAEALQQADCSPDDEVALTTTLDGRRDVRVFAPDTGPDSCVRDDAGRIIGVRRLVEYEPLSAATIRRSSAKTSGANTKRARATK